MVTDTSVRPPHFDKVFQEVEGIVNKFLAKNGGMENGYCTWVEYDKFGDFKWWTPAALDLTYREMRKRGSVLYDALHDVLHDHGIIGAHIVISCKYLEDGCWRTIIQIVSEQNVRLNFKCSPTPKSRKSKRAARS